MKKLNCFILTCFISLNFFSFTAFAEEKFISVGLTKYKGVSNISLDNNYITLGKENNYSFSSDFSLNSSSNFTIKPLSNYTIKYTQSFSSYNEALSISMNYNDSYVYKENNYYTMIGNFNSSSEANNFMLNQNINGEVLKLDNTIGIYDNNKLLIAYKDSIAIKSNDYISLGNKPYRNFINIVSKNNRLVTTNIVNVEEYLYGVVPSEMPPSWSKEALKAQSVAARNYAYSNAGIHKNEGFDLCDTIHCQVYEGVNNEQQSTNQAIDETKGVLAYYNNQLINTVYSSSSGGYTDDAINVWNDNIPYLKAVKDEFEEGAKQWTRTFTFDELSSVASVGTVNEVILENSSITGRANRLTLVGTNGNKVLEKDEIRTFFSKFNGGTLESKNFKMSKGNTYISPNTTKSSKAIVNNTNSNIVVISSKGNNPINKENSFVIDKNNNTSKVKDTFIIDKNNNTSNLLNNISNEKPQNNIAESVNYASKVSRQDSNSITFIGKGWGHGVGMSQYGANSLAKKGYKYDEILKYYYTGIEVR